MELSRAYTRQLLERVVTSDSELDAFCMDYFPQVFRQFSSGTNRVQKHNVLLEQANLQQIVEALQQWDLLAVERVAEEFVENAGPTLGG